MNRFGIAFVALTASLPGVAAAQDTQVAAAVEQQYDEHLEDLFVWFHQNPELSFLETDTAARMAAELRAAGLEVTEGVGGTGVVGMVSNGPGPLVLIRADMDGLPVEERSGLDYASQATQVDRDGVEYPVMHACGHDVHITSMVGTARQLMAMRDRWRNVSAAPGPCWKTGCTTALARLITHLPCTCRQTTPPARSAERKGSLPPVRIR